MVQYLDVLFNFVVLLSSSQTLISLAIKQIITWLISKHVIIYFALCLWQVEHSA